jgi:hypothetical protein
MPMPEIPQSPPARPSVLAAAALWLWRLANTALLAAAVWLVWLYLDEAKATRMALLALVDYVSVIAERIR